MSYPAASAQTFRGTKGQPSAQIFEGSAREAGMQSRPMVARDLQCKFATYLDAALAASCSISSRCCAKVLLLSRAAAMAPAATAALAHFSRVRSSQPRESEKVVDLCHTCKSPTCRPPAPSFQCNGFQSPQAPAVLQISGPKLQDPFGHTPPPPRTALVRVRCSPP